MSEQHSYKKMKVTPAMAAAWLEKNTFNRPLSEVRAKAMAKDMLEGNWRLSPDPIVIGKDGVLYNAQHRLRALVLSGTSQEFLVLQNADPGLRMVIDQGRSRNTAETLRFAGSDLTSHDVARLNMMARIPNGTAQVLTAFQIERMSATFSDEILWARKTFANANKITGKAAVVAGFMYAWRANPGGIGKFAAEVQEGANLAPDTAALALRKYLFERVPATNESRRQIALKVLWACRKQLLGVPVYRVYAEDEPIQFFGAFHTASKP